jgi:hypothetical protein
MIANAPLQFSGCQVTRDTRSVALQFIPALMGIIKSCGHNPFIGISLGELRHGNIVRSALTGIYEWKSIR